MTMLLLPNIFLMLLFTHFKHPLSMTLLIICQTLILSVSMSLTTKTFWMSYILFLVFLGGMLVLFLYITSLASNEILNTTNQSTTLTTYMLIIGLMIIMLYSLHDWTLWNLFSSNMEMQPLHTSNLFLPHTTLSFPLLKLYNTPSSILTMMLIIYLLLTLIAIVKITNIFMGPLRPNSFTTYL
nr:NADH dehydrogenase subunit 6 [Typhoptera quadrituberculata]